VVTLEIGNREFSQVADGQFDMWLLSNGSKELQS